VLLLLQGSGASSSMDCCGHLAPCVGDWDALQAEHSTRVVVVVGGVGGAGGVSTV
jgi:hypothetical protein